MVEYYEIESIRSKEKEILGAFTPLEIETIIKWGGDSQELDGLKQWRVIRKI